MRKDNLRPDGVAICVMGKKIGILEICRPFNSFSDQLQVAHDSKNLKYAIVEEALRKYSTAGLRDNMSKFYHGLSGSNDWS